jgi:predicted O-methyltransferase YrrM
MKSEGEIAMTEYRHLQETPDLVRNALALAQTLGFTHSCTDETGRLLRLLASQYTSGTIAEIGTGCGVGATWMAASLNPSVRLVTVELDEMRANAAQSLFGGTPNVSVLLGDWSQLREHAPFAMLFADGGKAKDVGAPDLIEMMQPGGLIVLDDLTPVEQWPDKWQGWQDPVRAFWLNDERVVAAEVRVSPTSAVLLATRR